ncbi:hypothetical protein Ciccas_009438 [Cichlidogyrus casuarinus]|uniref:Uncharacterized protein n=1 Tax=Cichlidogyrus casuarinus TaxID=1844966 RepID=A0ABD2Q1H6_9PLAT
MSDGHSTRSRGQHTRHFLSCNEYDSSILKSIGRNPSLSSSIIPGCPGAPGLYGPEGVSDAQPGSWGQTGSVRWVLEHQQASESETSACTIYSDRYEAAVTEYSVKNVFLDSNQGSDVPAYLRPRDEILISDITVQNQSSEMVLPAGALLTFCSTPSVLMKPYQYFLLPELGPLEKLQVPMQFEGRVHDALLPNRPGPVEAHAEVASKITLIGRPFSAGRLVKTLPINFPIGFADIAAPESAYPAQSITVPVTVSLRM